MRVHDKVQSVSRVSTGLEVQGSQEFVGKIKAHHSVVEAIGRAYEC